MKLYVLGFLFSVDNKSVVLIRKETPKWQAGKLNGVGGKVEEGESPRGAMMREFEEETGQHVPWSWWRHFATLVGADYMVHCFAVANDHAHALVETKTAEEIVRHDVDSLSRKELLHNVRYLIDIALDSGQLANGPILLQYGKTL